MIELRAKAIGEAHCPFCREGLSSMANYTCSGCDVVYHEACARELSTCATLGCEELLEPVRTSGAPRREDFRAEDWEPALEPTSAEESPTCRGCFQSLHGPQHDCPACDAVYHTGCAYGEGTCRKCRARLFPRRSFGEWCLDLFDSVMEGAVGLACVGGIVGVLGIMAYFMNHLSVTTLEENMLLLLILPPAILALSLGVGMLARGAWRNYSREIRRRAPR